MSSAMHEGADDPRKIVRVYSTHAQDRFPPGSNVHSLSRVLTDKESSREDIIEPWRRFYEPWNTQDKESNPITKVLAVEAEKLRQQWMNFQNQNSKEDQLEVKKYEPTIEGVFDMVADVEKMWQAKREKGKRGRTMMHFSRLCRTLDAHSNILEVVPKGNEYVSIFAGTITTIIKASANHDAIAEELSQALSTISEHIADCSTELHLFHTEEMQRAIADLYAHVFLFLNDTMVWYTKKRRRRLLDSFNEKFMQEFEAEIDNIVRKSDRIKRRAAQMSMAEQRVTRMTVEETSKDLRLGLEGILRESAEAKVYAKQVGEHMERQRREQKMERANNAQLFQNLMQLLTDIAEARSGNDSSLLHEDISSSRKRRSFIEDIALQEMIISKDTLLICSAPLEDYFHRDRVCLEVDSFTGSAQIPFSAIKSLAEWIQDTQSRQTLCISMHDSPTDDFLSPMSKLSAQFLAFSSASNVSAISYFCELRRGERLRGRNTAEQQGLLALAYCLLRQMTELAPLKIQTSLDLSQERFQELDGTMHTWELLLQLFKDVQSIIHRKLYCVVDGFQWLDDAETSEYMNEFVATLQHEKFRIVFTTSGMSRCLLTCLKRDELVVLEGRDESGEGSLWEVGEGFLVEQ